MHQYRSDKHWDIFEASYHLKIWVNYTDLSEISICFSLVILQSRAASVADVFHEPQWTNVNVSDNNHSQNCTISSDILYKQHNYVHFDLRFVITYSKKRQQHRISRTLPCADPEWWARKGILSPEFETRTLLHWKTTDFCLLTELGHWIRTRASRIRHWICMWIPQTVLVNSGFKTAEEKPTQVDLAHMKTRWSPAWITTFSRLWTHHGEKFVPFLPSCVCSKDGKSQG